MAEGQRAGAATRRALDEQIVDAAEGALQQQPRQQIELGALDVELEEGEGGSGAVGGTRRVAVALAVAGVAWQPRAHQLREVDGGYRLAAEAAHGGGVRATAAHRGAHRGGAGVAGHVEVERRVRLPRRRGHEGEAVAVGQLLQRLRKLGLRLDDVQLEALARRAQLRRDARPLDARPVAVVGTDVEDDDATASRRSTRAVKQRLDHHSPAVLGLTLACI